MALYKDYTYEEAAAKFRRIARDAREQLRDVLKMIALHEKELVAGLDAAYLNPSTALMAAAVWERFASDLYLSATEPGWSRAGDGDAAVRGDKQAAWPRVANGRVLPPKIAELSLCADETEAQNVATIGDAWTGWVSTGWFGKRPTGWVFVPDGGERGEAGDRVLRTALLGARSARDAAAHGLFFKKADDATMTKADGKQVVLDSSHEAWHYDWWSDNHDRMNPNRKPTIQSGYARGKAALFVQLVDASIAAVAGACGFDPSSRLPSDWFDVSPKSGAGIAGIELWGGEYLHRVR